MKKRIAILYGGRTGEHEVSLVSASYIARHLDQAMYDVSLIGIDKDGAWYLQGEGELSRCRNGGEALVVTADPARRISVLPGGGAVSGFMLAAEPFHVDVVFPVLHGTFGEDGTAQGLLEMAGMAYVGAGVLGSAIGMDKEKAKALWIQAGLPVVPYLAVRNREWAAADHRASLIDKAERDFRYPLFVKPARAGSSVGASIAADRAALESAVKNAFAWDDKILIEPFMRAREVECSVTGNNKPEAYTPGEIVPNHEFYDYDAKYLDPDGAALLIPADLDESALRAVREIALKAYKTAELCGLARVDFFLRKETGEILLNEVNTMPGFTTISMFPKMCEASGLSYPRLLDRLIQYAEERFAAVHDRRYSRDER